MTLKKYFFSNRLLIAGFFMAFSCGQPSPEVEEVQEEIVNNVYEESSVTEGSISLGRLLFYEKGLSQDSSISCASCHMQEYAFADTARVSVGVHGELGFRNAQGLFNLIYKESFFRDGGVNTIQRATIPPMQTEFEMNLNIRELLSRLNSNEEYRELFLKEFNSEANHRNVLQSLAAFQSTFISLGSKYDTYLNGGLSTLSEYEKAGKELFFSDELGCVSCHKGNHFTDGLTHNIGLYQDYEDYGRGRVTLDSADFGKFKTPSLRNVGVTYPYMHDGSLGSLEEVINFYATGGENHNNKSELLHPFVISEMEKIQLISFLNTLTDQRFLDNEEFSNPFKTGVNSSL